MSLAAGGKPMVDGGGPALTLFERLLENVLDREGGPTNDPADPGGATWFGLSRVSHPLIPWPPTLSQAKAIYRAQYWMPIRADGLPAPLACVCFDAAVVQGVGWATGALQRVLGVKLDHVIGPKTLAAAAVSGPEEVVRFTNLRMEEFQRITRFRPTSLKYLLGWQLRALRVLREAVLLEREV